MVGAAPSRYGYFTPQRTRLCCYAMSTAAALRCSSTEQMQYEAAFFSWTQQIPPDRLLRPRSIASAPRQITCCSVLFGGLFWSRFWGTDEGLLRSYKQVFQSAVGWLKHVDMLRSCRRAPGLRARKIAGQHGGVSESRSSRSVNKVQPLCQHQRCDGNTSRRAVLPVEWGSRGAVP